MSWVTSRNDYHTSKNTAGCSCHRAAKRQDTTWLNIMLTINSAYIIEINVLVERNVSVFVVAILATIRWTGLNHSNCRLKAGGNFKDLVGGLWWIDLISSTGDTQQWKQRWRWRVEHMARTAGFDWLLMPSCNTDKVHQWIFIGDAVTLNYPILVED